MSRETAAPLLGRLLAVLSALVAILLGLLGLVCLPPLLGRWILAAGRVEPGTPTILGWVLGLLLLAGAWLGLRRSRRLWSQATQVAPRKVQFAWITLVLGGCASFGLLEIAARSVTTLDKVLSGDTRNRYLWVSQRPTGPTPERLSSNYPDRYDPELGWVPAEGFRSERVNVNAAGLRGRREHPFVKQPGEKRIVVTGDSFTWGEDVADDEVYTEVLDTMLEDTGVVNLGVHGYGTDQQYLRLKAIGFGYDPDLVILSYYKSNADRNVLSFRSYAKPRFRLVDGHLSLENQPVPAPDDPSVADYDPGVRSYLWELLKRTASRAAGHTRFAAKWELTRAILDAVHDETRAHGVPFLLVYIPAARPHFSRAPEAAETILADWAARAGVPFLNLRPRFLALPEEQRSRLYAGHWTAEGHRVAAAWIAERIAADGML